MKTTHMLVAPGDGDGEAAAEDLLFIDRCKGEIENLQAHSELAWWTQVRALAEERVRALEMGERAAAAEKKEAVGGEVEATALAADATATEEGAVAAARAAGAEEARKAAEERFAAERDGEFVHVDVVRALHGRR